MPKILAMICFILLVETVHADDDRFWVEGKINGKSVTFAFDTGSPYCVLFKDTLSQLGLTNGPGGETTTDNCTLEIGTNRCRLWFKLFPSLSPSLSPPPLLGWKCFKENIIEFDAEARRVRFLGDLPENISTWTKVPMATISDPDILTFIVSNRYQAQALMIDTGDSGGVFLPPKAWKKWRRENKNKPFKLLETFNIDGEPSIKPESWAKSIALGSILLTETPVSK